jgi:Abortive infection alpha
MTRPRCVAAVECDPAHIRWPCERNREMTHVSRQNSEDDADSVAPLSADDLGLEKLGELGASVLLIRNVASEVVSTAEHVRSAATSVWNALSHLSNSDGSQVASTGTGSGLAAVTDAFGDVLGAARGRSSARDKEQPTGDSADSYPEASTSDANTPTTVVGLPVTGILGAYPLTEVVGKVIDTAAKPVGEGLRQAQRIATAPIAGISDIVEKVAGRGARDETDALRKRGNALIGISYQPELQRRDVHPSFSHILDELLPDEARILRFLGVAGAQPMIDVRTKMLFQIGSVLLVGGVSMVASMAGCHWPDRDQHYFANLSRLGLVDLSHEPVDDYRRYALLEVQPVALHAIENVPKAITIYRSIALTAFGRQFIDVCINTEGYNAGGWDTDGRQDKIRRQRNQDRGSPSRKQA